MKNITSKFLERFTETETHRFIRQGARLYICDAAANTHVFDINEDLLDPECEDGDDVRFAEDVLGEHIRIERQDTAAFFGVDGQTVFLDCDGDSKRYAAYYEVTPAVEVEEGQAVEIATPAAMFREWAKVARSRGDEAEAWDELCEIARFYWSATHDEEKFGIYGHAVQESAV